MRKIKKIISSILLCALLAPVISVSASAIECEDPNVTSTREQGRQFKEATMNGATMSNGQQSGHNASIDPDAKAESDQKDQEGRMGLFGKVMNCATLFIQAGMSPGNIKKAACSMKCFTSIKEGCKFSLKYGVITFKKGAPAYAICPPIMPMVMMF